jgi:hypothetical protein
MKQNRQRKPLSCGDKITPRQISERLRRFESGELPPEWLRALYRRIFETELPLKSKTDAFCNGAMVGHYYAETARSFESENDKRPPGQKAKRKEWEQYLDALGDSLRAIQRKLSEVLAVGWVSSDGLPVVFEWLSGFSYGVECMIRASETRKPTVAHPTYEKLIHHQERVATLRTAKELRELLLTELPANCVGDLERIKKLCARIGLSFPRGRPRAK